MFRQKASYLEICHLLVALIPCSSFPKENWAIILSSLFPVILITIHRFITFLLFFIFLQTEEKSIIISYSILVLLPPSSISLYREQDKASEPDGILMIFICSYFLVFDSLG